MYSVFLDRLRLPVTPGKIETKIKNKNKTMTLLSGDEINILKTPGLTELEFEMLIPGVLYPFARYDNGYKPPDYFLSKLESLKTDLAPFDFKISRVNSGKLTYDNNIRVSLEDYSITESADDGRDLKVKVKLKQYVDYGVKVKVLTQVSAGGTATVKAQQTPTRPSKTPAKTYTVKKNDTLWAICKKELGDGSKYPSIAKLNNIVNPNLIYPGQVIKFE